MGAFQRNSPRCSFLVETCSFGQRSVSEQARKHFLELIYFPLAATRRDSPHQLLWLIER